MSELEKIHALNNAINASNGFNTSDVVLRLIEEVTANDDVIDPRTTGTLMAAFMCLAKIIKDQDQRIRHLESQR